jgi:signal transduction histidine kinase
MSVKMLTLLAAAGMSWRVASAERRARSLLEREHERALQERLEMREKLQHIDRLATLGTLSAGLAHEINGPLTSILGYSQTGLEFASADAEQAKMFAGIESAARRCRDIVKNTLAFARSRAGEREPADLNALLRQCVALKRHDWLGGTVSIEESYDPDLPRASVKGAEIQQIVFNLLTNAEQAIRSVPGAGGAIRVATSSADGRVRIRIEDDGPGIPESSLKKIWEPFYTTKPVGQGTGLGLAISRTIAQNHGGTLDVETSPGRTAFVLALPVETAKIG